LSLVFDAAINDLTVYQITSKYTSKWHGSKPRYMSWWRKVILE